MIKEFLIWFTNGILSPPLIIQMMLFFLILALILPFLLNSETEEY